MRRLLLLGVGVGLGASSQAMAGLVMGTASGFAIDGSAVHASDIEIAAAYGEALQDLTIEVRLFGFDHARLGDLVVTLRHLESGASSVLFANVGQTLHDGGSQAGLSGAYAFRDAALEWSGSNLWSAAEAADQGLVPGAFYYATTHGSDAFISLDAAFAGVSSAGTWRLEVEDTVPQSSDGSMMKWSIVLYGTTVPTPAALAILGAAGLFRHRLRRA